jgi:hypothetical protein
MRWLECDEPLWFQLWIEFRVRFRIWFIDHGDVCAR